MKKYENQDLNAVVDEMILGLGKEPIFVTALHEEFSTKIRGKEAFVRITVTNDWDDF